MLNYSTECRKQIVDSQFPAVAQEINRSSQLFAEFLKNFDRNSSIVNFFARWLGRLPEVGLGVGVGGEERKPSGEWSHITGTNPLALPLLFLSLSLRVVVVVHPRARSCVGIFLLP